jgi:hypothetical protein
VPAWQAPLAVQPWLQTHSVVAPRSQVAPAPQAGSLGPHWQRPSLQRSAVATLQAKQVSPLVPHLSNAVEPPMQVPLGPPLQQLLGQLSSAQAGQLALQIPRQQT